LNIQDDALPFPPLIKGGEGGFGVGDNNSGDKKISKNK